MLYVMDGGPEAPLLTLVGHERHGRFFWNLPVARLCVCGESVSIVPTASWLRFVVPPWHAAMRELSEVEAVRNGMWRGVRIRTKSGEYRIFSCSAGQAARVIDCFTSLGVSVEREPQKVSFIDPRI